MNLRPRRRSESEINVVPLIDVMFMLVIFFVVSTTFERRSEISINLPEASEERTDPAVQQVDVSVDASGRVWVNGVALVNTQVNTIREALKDARRGLDDPPVVISADRETTHQSVVRIMDAARQAGLVRITFATRIDEADGAR
jgi:biopolymer transport protein ExbD